LELFVKSPCKALAEFPHPFLVGLFLGKMKHKIKNPAGDLQRVTMLSDQGIP
jgi:hypothetical protein